jgi:DNA-binding LacI/PurR family transcriptional regulator
MSCKDLAHAAVLSLLAHLNPGEPPTTLKHPIPTRLILRQTTGVPRHSKKRPSGHQATTRAKT